MTRNFEIIGEAVNKIPLDIKGKYPEVPWKQMYGLRNFAVHDHTIDPVILWEISQEHLPQDKIKIEKIISNEQGE